MIIIVALIEAMYSPDNEADCISHVLLLRGVSLAALVSLWRKLAAEYMSHCQGSIHAHTYIYI